MITRATKQINRSLIDEGLVLLIDKAKHKTSFDVIRDVRRTLKLKKAGHAGTLDPMATGLLIVCTGRMTKRISEYQGLNKTYTGTIKLGAVTPSMDAETEAVDFKDYTGISESKVISESRKFLGNIEQIPPMYSALKHNGKALYKYARKGEEVERKPRTVNIEKFEIKEVNLPLINFEIVCSKGTYIRVIANDLGENLGCGGYLCSLRREGIGSYSVEDAVTVNDLKNIAIIEEQPVH